MKSVFKIGHQNKDSEFVRLQKTLLVCLSFFTSLGALLWGGICTYYELTPQSIIPYSYVGISFFNMLVFSLHKKIDSAKYVQLIFSMVLPFVFQWSLGGLEASGIIMIWSLLALVSSAFLLGSNENGTIWLLIFLVLIAVSVYFDAYFQRTFPIKVIGESSITFAIINIVSVCFVLFGLVVYFVKDQKQTHVHLKEKREELERTNTSLNTASRAKSQFLANVSHEIRTPLNGIIGTSALLEDTKLDKEQTQLLNSLQHSGRILLGLISDVLDITQIEENKLILNTLPVNLQNEVTKVFRILQVQAKEKREDVMLHIKYDHSIPEYLECDALRLNQILINLMNNAIKFTHEGSITLKATLLKTKKNVANIEFKVIDTGIGIPEEKQAHIFDEFYQVNQVIREGSGLGLTITKNLVKIMGGDLDFDSTPFKGTTFKFTVPLPITKPVTVKEEAEQVEDISKDMKILIAEDNPINMMIAKKVLSKMGFAEVSEAENGLLAVEKTRDHQFDLILMDINMPKMTGVEAAKEIFGYYKDLGETPPVIGALTANAMKNEQQEYLDIGMSFVLSKPFMQEDLKEKINQFVELG